MKPSTTRVFSFSCQNWIFPMIICASFLPASRNFWMSAFYLSISVLTFTFWSPAA